MREELTRISSLEQHRTIYSPANESPLQLNASSLPRAELDSYTAAQSSSRQFEHARSDGMPNPSKNAHKAFSLDNRTSQEKVVESPSHQWTDFPANIPGFLSPYPCGEGFSVHDSNRYLAFCEFRIAMDHLYSS
jgi:hypothetical protein